MSTTDEALDPRVRRTRSGLQCALAGLLHERDFEKISVGDIAEQAGLNRATFYDHYPDKFALFEALVADRFDQLMRERGVIAAGGCASANKAVVLAVCDYLAATPRLDFERQRQMEPHLETAVIAIVRKLLLQGLQMHPPAADVAPEMVAATAAWAIYGAAKEWVSTPNRCPSETISEAIVTLVAPILAPAAPTPV